MVIYGCMREITEILKLYRKKYNSDLDIKKSWKIFCCWKNWQSLAHCYGYFTFFISRDKIGRQWSSKIALTAA